MSTSEERFEAIIKKLRSLINSAVDDEVAEQQALGATASSLSSSELIELIIGARAVRNRLLNSRLFGEPAWDILLGLYVAYHHGLPVSAVAAATMGDTEGSTGHRWLAALEREGLIERTAERSGQRFIGLSAEAVQRMDEYAGAFGEWAATKARLTRK